MVIITQGRRFKRKSSFFLPNLSVMTHVHSRRGRERVDCLILNVIQEIVLYDLDGEVKAHTNELSVLHH